MFNPGSLRDQPVTVVDLNTGETICTVKVGPKTHIYHVKEDIEKDTGIAVREQKILFGNNKYNHCDTVGAAIFKDAFDRDATPQFSFVHLQPEEADRQEGIHQAIEQIRDHDVKLKDVEEEYRSEAEVVLYAMENINASELQHAGDNVKGDIPTMLLALKINTTAMYYVADSLWQDRNFMRSAVQIDGLLLGARMVPTEWRSDVEIVMFACETNGMALKFATEELKADRSVVMAAVMQRGTALMYASEELKSDYYVVLDAVRNNKMAIVHAKGGLREDDDIRAAAGQGPSDKMMEKVERIKAKFHELDTNGDGYLSYEELEALLRKGNPDLDETEIRLLYDQMDTHHDGKVDFHEFCDFVFRED